MKNSLFVAGIFILFLAACSKGNKNNENNKNQTQQRSLNEQARIIFSALPKTAENPNNKITNEKIKLGKILFYDKQLSKNNTQSCNTCHNLASYGVDNLASSPGDNGIPGTRNSPTVLNAALQFVQFWDGREPDVEAQAGGPVLNPAEMAMPDEHAVIKRLSKVPMYKELFKAAFPNEENPISYDNMKKAIGAFERTLITPTRFDEYLNGKDDALTKAEQKGLKVFLEIGCTTCHVGQNLGGTMFQKFGMFSDYAKLTKSAVIDSGRYMVTHKTADIFMFKVPILRNIEKTAPYFHDGSVANLNEAIKIMAKLELNKDLTEEQIKDIITFLKTLTAEIPENWKTEPQELVK